MHFQFLIEDQSSEILIRLVMQKLLVEYSNITYDCKSFRGIGGFTKKNTIKETKTGKLLNDLATYLRGFNKSLSGFSSAIFVILDNDDRDTPVFMQDLERVAQQNNIIMDYVFCIAVEEVEAWLLGDENALLCAYPNARLSVLHSYIQDSVCGTWEVLANTVFPGGMKKIRNNNYSYVQIGALKCEWSEKIGHYLNIHNNKSPSFNLFLQELIRRIPS